MTLSRIFAFDLRVEVLNHVLKHGRHHFFLKADGRSCTPRVWVFLTKDLEGAKSHERWRNSCDYSTFLKNGISIVERVSLDFCIVADD